MVKKLKRVEIALNSVTSSFPQAHLEWTSPTEKQRLQSRFQSVVDPGGMQDALGADGALRYRNGGMPVEADSFGERSLRRVLQQYVMHYNDVSYPPPRYVVENPSLR